MLATSNLGKSRKYKFYKLNGNYPRNNSRCSNDLAIRNVIGSNIFNVLLTICSIIKHVSFNHYIAILFGGTIFLIIAIFTGKIKKLDRWEAFILLAFYLVYTGHIVSKKL